MTDTAFRKGQQLRTTYEYSDTVTVIRASRGQAGKLPVGWHLCRYPDGGVNWIHADMLRPSNQEGRAE